MEDWSSWFMADDLKSSGVERLPGVRIPHPPPIFISRCSSVGYERLLYTQNVIGSSPISGTS